MKKIIHIFKVTLITSILFGCSLEEDWTDPVDDIPPQSISNPKVENLNGGARIWYTLPGDTDLLGVKAIYSFNENGEELEAFASAYRDTIELSGFPDTNERIVKLISIDKSKNESEPVEVKIQPLVPPVELIRQSMVVKPTYGGIFVSWMNPNREDLGISLNAADSTGQLGYDYTFYTNEAVGKYSFRGYDDTERKFQIEVRDRWDNFAAPLDTVLKPLFEEKLIGITEDDVPIFTQYGFDDRLVLWRGDVHRYNHDTRLPFSNLFYHKRGELIFQKNFAMHRSGNLLRPYTNNPDDNFEVLPIYFIIDLGSEYRVSRHRAWHKGGIELAAQSPKYYEIWATNETPKGGPSDFTDQMESLAYWTAWPEVGGTDAWKNDWVKIAECALLPPSGANELTDVTEEDRQWANQNGFDFEIFPEVNTEPFRYLRIVITQRSWGGMTNIQINEFEFWGSHVNK